MLHGFLNGRFTDRICETENTSSITAISPELMWKKNNGISNLEHPHGEHTPIAPSRRDCRLP